MCAHAARGVCGRNGRRSSTRIIAEVEIEISRQLPETLGIRQDTRFNAMYDLGNAASGVRLKVCVRTFSVGRSISFVYMRNILCH